MNITYSSRIRAIITVLCLVPACSSKSSEPPEGAAGFSQTSSAGGAYGGAATNTSTAGSGVGAGAPQGGSPPVSGGGNEPGAGGPPGGHTGNGGGAGSLGTGGVSDVGSGGSSEARGGAGGSQGGAAGSQGGAAGGGGTPGSDKPRCVTDSSQVILMGDSYVNWGTHTFPTDMNTVSMLNIQDYAVGGFSMGSGGIGLIPPQFDSALLTHMDIRVVILDGGGNDVLIPDALMFPNGGQCKNMGAQSTMIPDCQKIVQIALDAGTKLFLHMADNNVKDAVYFFYPHVPLNTALGGTDPNGMLDYALPKIQKLCDDAIQISTMANPQKPIRCHFVSLVPVFQGHMEYFSAGDVHPNSMGSKAMAQAVWAKMKQDCVGQPASSGCCEP